MVVFPFFLVDNLLGREHPALLASRPPGPRLLCTLALMLVTLLAFTLRTLLGEHNRAWLLPQRAPTWDAGGFVQSWLDRRAELVTDQGGAAIIF